MNDYSYPSIFLSYLMFFIFLAGGVFFFIRTHSRGDYFGATSEEPKFRMLNDEESEHGR